MFDHSGFIWIILLEIFDCHYLLCKEQLIPRPDALFSKGLQISAQILMHVWPPASASFDSDFKIFTIRSMNKVSLELQSHLFWLKKLKINNLTVNSDSRVFFRLLSPLVAPTATCIFAITVPSNLKCADNVSAFRDSSVIDSLAVLVCFINEFHSNVVHSAVLPTKSILKFIVFRIASSTAARVGFKETSLDSRQWDTESTFWMCLPNNCVMP